MKFTREGFFHGSQLLALSISLYSFSVLMEVTGWKYWAFIAATFFYLGYSLKEFFS